MRHKGQSIIEVLIAVGIGTVLLAVAASLIRPAILQNNQVGQVQAKSSLASELLGNVQAWAPGNWNTILTLATTSANLYYLTPSSSVFVVVGTSTGQSVTVNSTTYTRFFYLDTIYRDGSGNATTVASGNTFDPSTIKVTVVANASGTGSSTTYQLFLTRSVSDVAGQSDWSGGSGNNAAGGQLGNNYAAGTNVNTASSGQIQLLHL